MSRKPASTPRPTSEPEGPLHASPEITAAAAAPNVQSPLSTEYRGGTTHALELGKSSMDAAVCLSACALDIYKNACCFAPQLTGYFELGSRLLAACAELQSNYFGLLMPHAEAIDSADWAAQSCEPAEVLERSMDIAMGALSAQWNFLEEVTEASVSYDLLGIGAGGGIRPNC